MSIVRIKNSVWNTLHHAGLDKMARRCQDELRARGWTHWMPLIPQQEFLESIREAIAELRRLAPTDDLGDYLEFGVSRGSSMACAFHALQAEGLVRPRLIGFDSFEGLPPEAADEGWTPGQYRSTMGATRRYLASRHVDQQRVMLVKGWFKETLSPQRRAALGLSKASLIMIDCDIYSASKEALWFCEPLIHHQAVIFFDDWGWRSDRREIGQQEAFREFLQTFPDLHAEERPGYLPQSRVFLVRRKLPVV